MLACRLLLSCRIDTRPAGVNGPAAASDARPARSDRRRRHRRAGLRGRLGCARLFGRPARRRRNAGRQDARGASRRRALRCRPHRADDALGLRGAVRRCRRALRHRARAPTRRPAGAPCLEPDRALRPACRSRAEPRRHRALRRAGRGTALPRVLRTRAARLRRARAALPASRASQSAEPHVARRPARLARAAGHRTLRAAVGCARHALPRPAAAPAVRPLCHLLRRLPR